MTESGKNTTPGPGVLIIDNIFYNRSQIRAILESSNYTVLEASNLTEGVFRLQTLKPELVIIGINLILSLGVKVLSLFFQQKSNIRIIAYNIYEGDTEFERKLLDNGVLAILDKPIEKEKVLKTVSDALAAKVTPPPALFQKQSAGKDINTEIVKTVVDTVVFVLSNITGAEAVRGQLFFLPVAFTTMGLGAIINVAGDFEGQIMVDMTEPAALFLASRLLKEEIPAMNELVASAIGELGNTIAGRAASGLARFGNIRISPPEVISDNTKNRIPEDRKIFIFPLGIGKHLINVNFFIRIRGQ